jgi:F-type H+-transporting ATPase subunit epsilon
MTEGLLQVALAAPERAPVHLEATEVVLPGTAGVFSVLAGHTPFLTTLTSGVMIVFTHDNRKRFFAVHGGFAEIEHHAVTVLADTVEAEEAVDLARAEAARVRALERLKLQEPEIDVIRAEAALARAMTRLQVRAKEGY